ncbi:hypothetical protein [Parabacteroides sp. PM5-20]|uniref:hypothetical protein n=2 Tax=unclassified Parabacteroides TaxID=2649774 RepID=UPI002476F061|nr:hypothetical protein [Parabacteroides sp. PM5-20]
MRKVLILWKNMTLRGKIILILISPFILILLLVLLLVMEMIISHMYGDYQAKYQYKSKADIESFIGIVFPNYKEIGREMEGHNRYGDSYKVNVTLKLEDSPELKIFYEKFKDLASVAPDWYSSSENNCSFGVIDWENRISYFLDINKIENTATLTYGGRGK